MPGPSAWRWNALVWVTLLMLVPVAFAATASITVSPASPYVGVGATQQFTATVTGLTNKTVTWSAGGVKGGNTTVGTITSTGLYTAPKKLPGQNPVTITATAAANTSVKGSTYVLILSAGPTLTSVSPNPLPTGTYTATVTGTGFVSGAVIFNSGIALQTTFVNSTTLTGGGYQASASSATFSVTNPGSTSSNSITIPVGTPITVNPATITLSLGQSQQFTSNTAGVTWTATAGTITSSGYYTAPSTLPSGGTATVTASANGSSASAVVTLLSTPPPTVSPSSVTLTLGSTQQFTSNTAGVTWSATAGSITSSGFYTAPNTLPSGGAATISATLNGAIGTATVTLVTNPPPTVTPATVTLSLGATQQFTSNTAGVTWSATSGSMSSSGLYTAPSTLPASGTATITATANGSSGTALVTLVNYPTPTISSFSLANVPLGVFSATITGTGFVTTSTAQLSGVTLVTTYLSPTQLSVAGYAAQTGSGSLVVSNGGNSSAPYSVQIGVTNPQVSAAAARRFLEQAAFGPTPTEAANVQTLGFQGWLSQQYAMAPVSNYNGLGSQGGMPARFLTNAVSNSDQLRQRVSFALGQIFVTSLNTVIWNTTMVPYQQTITNDAFGNFYTLLHDVTLAPAMGQFLNMANNAAGNPAQGTFANENYAREVMQLFTVGTVMLNPDGTPQLDSKGNPISTYTQITISETARAFTGWTYAPVSGSVQWNAYINPDAPMVNYDPQHDFGAKTLLAGYAEPANVSTQQDLTNTLTNIFNHPNVGPFIATRLIQHLVKSNPSPAYVQRVANAFNNNGLGVRGDMQAVISSILLDPEARANDEGGADQALDGHFQEPALFIAGMVRAFGGQMNDQNYYSYDLYNMSQDLYNPPSVFNYYSPAYIVPNTTLLAPEVQIYTPYTSVYRANVVQGLFGAYSNPVLTYGPGTTVDVTAYLPLASNPATLVGAMDIALTHGTMPAAMKNIIISQVAGDTMGALDQVETAAYLILTSNYYNVWH